MELDPAELVAQSDQVSVALLVLLETLSPAERIALVLHDVFGLSFDEIADVLDRSPEAARQLASRARRRVRGAGSPPRPDRARGRRIVEAWLTAVRDGDVRALLGCSTTGRCSARTTAARCNGSRAPNAIVGQAVLAGRLAAHSIPVLIDGRPGVAAVMHGRVVSIMAFELDGDRIVGLDVLADPTRLEGLGAGPDDGWLIEQAPDDV